ncbi:Unannotated [Lentimonas sp. CC4]|nr:Unannotated [Lentimonas sp. CC4]CAA6685665.1 Unannotated [Lentimonas sp. CC6]CAA7077109.1 Unannotated [Lentimonas sp. CC4]CAA7168809.1 Unannotated [Lentimonas sp. CC21]CAA7180825.1 Unannotated [Lentimonas sp. CC8]
MLFQCLDHFSEDRQECLCHFFDLSGVVAVFAEQSPYVSDIRRSKFGVGRSTFSVVVIAGFLFNLCELY